MPLTAKAEMVVQGAEIPSIPRVLQEILARTRDPDTSIAELEERIRREPGLVVRLLKTANSPLYAAGAEIVSVRQAVVRLGFTGLRSLVSGLALIDAFHNLPGLDKEYVLLVWKRSLGAAGLARALARPARAGDPEALFLAALAQDSGRIVLDQYFQNEYRALRKEEPFPPPEEERRAFGTDHAHVGALLLERWNFPAQVVETVRSHHGDAREKERPRAAALTELSFLLAGRTDLEESLAGEEPWEGLPPELLEEAGLAWEELRERREELRKARDAAAPLLS